MTVPSPGFVPPEPYPDEPGYGKVWYGTPRLWTMLDAGGEIWSDLPIGTGLHAIGDKTLWFSEDFSNAAREDFSGDANITLTAVRLDGPARTVIETSGVPSFNASIKNFILVGLGVPKIGCWGLTAAYKGTELEYVFRVDG